MICPSPIAPAFRRPESRLQPAERLLDLVALPAQRVGQQLRREDLLEADLRPLVDLVRDIDDPRPVLIDRLGDPAAQFFAQGLVHRSPSSCGIGPPPPQRVSISPS
jgi:hypothetical protein